MKVTIEKVDDTYIFTCENGAKKAGKYYEVLTIIKDLFNETGKRKPNKPTVKKKVKRK